MRHYIPLQTATGWAVAYGNHLGEFVAVMECPTLEAAYREACDLSAQAMREAARMLEAAPMAASVAHKGNSYMRRFS